MRAAERLTRPADEIVADIAHALGTGPESKAYIQEFVAAAAGLSEFPAMLGNQRANKDYARKILKWIRGGQKLFARVPESHFLALLFGREQNAPLNSPEAVEALIRPAQAEYAEFTDLLASLRARCEWLIQEKIGEHGHAGYHQERAAIGARHLCKKFGRQLAWSSPTSAYRITAGLNWRQGPALFLS